MVIVCILALRQLSPMLPAPLIAVAGSMVASSMYDFAGHGIRVIGAVAGGLPTLGLPDVSWTDAVAHGTNADFFLAFS